VVEVGMVAHAAVTGKRQDRMFYTGLAVVAAAIAFAGAYILPTCGAD
jgi:hypothetical protein